MGFLAPGARRAKAAAALVSAGAVLLLSTAPAAAQQAPLLRQAKSALLKQSDFPSTWLVQGSVRALHGSSNPFFPGGTQALQQFGTCIGASSAMQGALSPPGYASPLFTAHGGAVFVQNVVSVFQSASLARQDYAMFARPKARACISAVEQSPVIRQQLAEGAGSGATVGKVTVTRPKRSWLIPRATGVTISVRISNQGQTATDAATVIFLVRGRLVSNVIFGAQGQQISSSLAHQLIATAHGRI